MPRRPGRLTTHWGVRRIAPQSTPTIMIGVLVTSPAMARQESSPDSVVDALNALVNTDLLLPTDVTLEDPTLQSPPPSIAPPSPPPSEVASAKYDQEQSVWVCTANLKRPITLLFRRQRREPCCAELSITDLEGRDLLESNRIQHRYGKEVHFAWNPQIGCAEAPVNLICSLRPNTGLSKRSLSYVANVRVTDHSGHTEELRLFVAAKSTADRKRSLNTSQNKKKFKLNASGATMCTQCGK